MSDEIARLTNELHKAVGELHDITILLRGSKDAPGMIQGYTDLRQQVLGNGKWGIAHKVSIMWRVWLWAGFIASGALGGVIAMLAKKII